VQRRERRRGLLQEAGQPVEILSPEKRWARRRAMADHAPSSHVRAAKRYQRRRKLKNVSKNRPDTTNLNHQYAIRCVDICTSSCWGHPNGHLNSA
jgi:hypothetical protein